MTLEEWQPVAGWEGLYEVSDAGRVRSVPHMTTCSDGRLMKRAGRVRKLSPDKDGYLQVCLYRPGFQRTYRVHRLVMAAFVGPCPRGMEVLHENGIPDDCRAVNLRYGTSSQNQLDKVRHGTDHNSRKTYCPQGHPYSPDNTYVTMQRSGRPRRMCRTCSIERQRRKRLEAGATPRQRKS